MPKKQSALAQWMETKKAPTRLIGDIERHLLERPADTSRRQDVLHPSELVKDDFCPRAAYYRLLGYTPPVERHALRLQSIFDHGHCIHAKWQNYLAEMGCLYGLWKASDDSTFWSMSSDIVDLSEVKYREVPLYDLDLRIEGSADGWVKGLGDDFLIEIKTIGPGTFRFEAPSLLRDGRDIFQAWKDTRRPFPSHLRQAQLYLEILHRMADKDLIDSAPEEVVFIYELKADQSVKEFNVPYDPSISEPAIQEAARVVAAVEAQQVPNCVKTSGSCKQCASFGDAS